jgi:hypothetical protein
MMDLIHEKMIGIEYCGEAEHHYKFILTTEMDGERKQYNINEHMELFEGYPKPKGIQLINLVMQVIELGKKVDELERVLDDQDNYRMEQNERGAR